MDNYDFNGNQTAEADDYISLEDNRFNNHRASGDISQNSSGQFATGFNVNGQNVSKQNENEKNFNSGIASFDVGGVNKPKQSAFANKNVETNSNQHKSTGFNANLAGFAVARDMAEKKNYHESNTNTASNTLKRESLFKNKSRAQYNNYAGAYDSNGAYGGRAFGMQNVLVNKHNNSNKTSKTVVISNETTSSKYKQNKQLTEQNIQKNPVFNATNIDATSENLNEVEQNSITPLTNQTTSKIEQVTDKNKNTENANQTKKLVEQTDKILNQIDENNSENKTDYIDLNVNSNHTTTSGDGYFSDIFTEDYNKKVTVTKNTEFDMSSSFGMLGKQINAHKSDSDDDEKPWSNYNVKFNQNVTNNTGNRPIYSSNQDMTGGIQANGFGGNIHFVRNGINGNAEKTTNNASGVTLARKNDSTVKVMTNSTKTFINSENNQRSGNPNFKVNYTQNLNHLESNNNHSSNIDENNQNNVVTSDGFRNVNQNNTVTNFSSNNQVIRNNQVVRNNQIVRNTNYTNNNSSIYNSNYVGNRANVNKSNHTNTTNYNATNNANTTNNANGVSNLGSQSGVNKPSFNSQSSPASRGINKGMFIGLDNNVSSYHKPKLTAEPPKPEQKKKSGLSNGLIDFSSLKSDDK